MLRPTAVSREEATHMLATIPTPVTGTPYSSRAETLTEPIDMTALLRAQEAHRA
jgi:hypothetical protein